MNNSIKIIIGTLVVCIALVIGTGGLLVYKNIISLNGSEVENAYVDAGKCNVQLKDTDQKRYFQGRVFVGYDKSDSGCKDDLVKNKQISVATEAINSYIRNQTYDYLNDVNNIGEIKRNLVEEVNKQLQTTKITEVKFYNYLLQ